MDLRRYDLIAKHYPTMWPFLVPGYLPICNAMLDVVRAHEGTPKDILDIGCGPGTATIACAPANDPNGQVTLLDGSEAMIEEAKRLLGSHIKKAIVGDFTDPDTLNAACPNQSYDLILASFALHHIDHDLKEFVIHSLAPALRPGGLLLLADEVAIERPGGWDVVERIRGRILDDHVKSGHITAEFMALETRSAQMHPLPFVPARVDDFVSWMAAAGLAVSCPIHIFGSALLIGLRA